MKGSVKELNKFHNYETEEITHKASNVAESIKLFGSSTRDRHAQRMVILRKSVYICVVVHDALGWKSRTTRNRFWRAGCSRLEYIRLVYYLNN